VPATAWHAPDYGSFLWASWDEDEYFLFNPASGQTHLLNGLAYELLQSLARCPADDRAIAQALYHPELGIPTETFHGLVNEQLHQLSLIGLVEQAP
jgi:PqqD family protein of HPr-rel-A system